MSVEQSRLQELVSLAQTWAGQLLEESAQVWCQLDGEPKQQPDRSTVADAVEHQARVVVLGQERGLVGIRVRTDRADRAAAVANLVAELLATRLRVLELEQRQRQQMSVLVLGEAAGSLVHAINNNLNSISVQASLLQMKLEGILRDKAEVIRREVSRAATRLQVVQQEQSWLTGSNQRCDMREITREFLAAWPEFADWLDAHLPQQPVFLRGSPTVLGRVVWLLSAIGLACMPKEARAKLTLAPGLLQLTLPGVSPETPEESGAPDSRDKVEQTLPPIRSAEEELQREAFAWLARQLELRRDIVVDAAGLTIRLTWNEA